MANRAPLNKKDALPSIAPSAALRDDYARSLITLTKRMTNSYDYWLKNKYKKAVTINQIAGRISAMDSKETPSSSTNALYAELDQLRTYWKKEFAAFALIVATKTITGWYKHNRNSWNSRLKNADLSVKFDKTPSQNLIIKAKIAENESLIKSIQTQYHTDVEGIVLRSFTSGRDLAQMTEDIAAREEISTRRAKLIARDQSNKTTSLFNDARQREISIQFCYWMHSAAGKEPRFNHVRAGREQWIYIVGEGIDFDDGFGKVKPGEAINCRCTGRSILPIAGRGSVESMDDLEAVPGFPGAYRAKSGIAVGRKSPMDVTKTRVPVGSPVKYS